MQVTKRRENNGMDIVLNFSGIVSGGGLQNALSFLDTLSLDKEKVRGCVAIVRKDAELHQLCLQRDIKHILFPRNKYTRLFHEYGCRKRFSRGQTCFTIFGPALFNSAGYLLNVNGCAFSNLFYPEIDFWTGYSPISRKKREYIDQYRRHWTAKADYWIFETAALKKRAVEICGFPESRVGVVRMAPSSLVAPEKVEEEISQAFDERITKGFRFLFLAGAQINKRIESLPDIAVALTKQGESDFVFVTTMPETHDHTIAISERFRSLGMEKHHCNIGPIPPSHVSSLINCIDAMCTFSRLESFSNNFIEAWRMEKPLLVTDADWAHDSCGDAALYVDPENAPETACQIASMMNSDKMLETVVAEGRKQLTNYPSAAEKVAQYYECINTAEQLGPCPERDKMKIHWPKFDNC